jgi:hypothetical protein
MAVAAAKRDQLLAERGLPACTKCKFMKHGHDLSYAGRPMNRWLACTHPAVEELQFDRLRGKLSVTPEKASVTRASDGLCGPEGVLYERKRFTKGDIFTLAWAGGITIGLLQTLFGH